MMPEINMSSKENGVHMCTICNQIDLWNEFSVCNGDCQHFKPIFAEIIGNETQAEICLDKIESQCKETRVRRETMPNLVRLT